MSHILLITSSPRGADSLSTRFASEFAQRLREQHPGSTLTIRDLYSDPLAHIDEAYVVGRTLAPDARTPAQAEAVGVAEALIGELAAADTVVIGSGMINFGPPTQLKAWFDYVTWPGVTFKYDNSGVEGLLTGKKVYLFTAAGGVFSDGPYAPLDYQSGYLKHLLGFIGLTDVEHLRVEGVAYGPEAAKTAIANAEAAVQSLLSEAV
ncbi:FMN-dependent NADH-azoreductase [Paraburkholderia sp. CNPSo 3076]|uniref:FMN-dependent NADH-azoreductase n=1 Tax=Paraburkholderia sp. CNPSo 3076 TaxID=2940936 RepID=UPI00225736ED|nr:FMN-dependent NADH-azoreductase [Paraburkholderia sp. CNPSo 3076]MCX5543783.1 FMN-dependent NADH-azoreductase [Paraburkholderia sp. CNPSo 3076]